MADVFISHANSMVRQARGAADALRALGYTVWIDDDLPAHRAFGPEIEAQLTAAKAALVIWSADAAKSDWVLSEANGAREAHKLVQLRLDGVRVPMPFDQIQCTDLAGWDGDPSHEGWRKVVASIVELTGGRRATQVAAPTGSAAHNQRVSVCVLPFANMSADAEQEYFSDGISEDIITDLSKVSALAVSSRNTAFTFKGKSVRGAEVARQLGVTHVLEGSVRKAGGRVRITAQLIEGTSDSHIWAERFDRDLDDIFTLQDEISQAIVAALKLRLLPEEQAAIGKRGTTSAEAYDLYLMARTDYASGDQGDPQWGETIVRLCRRATEIDPNYAEAWSQLALGQVASRYMLGGAGDDGSAAAEHALSLNPGLADAYAVKARVSSDSGRHAEANVEIAEALRLAPDSATVNYQAGIVFFAQERIDDAIRHFEAAQSRDETDVLSPSFLVGCYVRKGDAASANRASAIVVSHAERVLSQDRNNSMVMSLGARALAQLGKRREAEEWIEHALLISPDSHVVRLNIACALAANLRDPEAAIDMLAPAFRKMTSNFLDLVRMAAELDSIREHPRYRALMAEAEARQA
jgi:adenylate cyclase